MKCPYCKIGVALDIKKGEVFETKACTYSGAELIRGTCPECSNLIIILKSGNYKWTDDGGEIDCKEEKVIYPQKISKLTDNLIPESYRNEFNEAYSILHISPKASAALSRRLLQKIIREHYNIKERDLSQEIDKFIALSTIPSEILSSVDAIRQIGNFSAHPMKYTNTGEIVDVEQGEAEWTIEVIEYLFDIAFIQPQKKVDREKALNQKLSALGKPFLKS